jgi:hypothetical protein
MAKCKVGDPTGTGWVCSRHDESLHLHVAALYDGAIVAMWNDVKWLGYTPADVTVPKMKVKSVAGWQTVWEEGK